MKKIVALLAFLPIAILSIAQVKHLHSDTQSWIVIPECSTNITELSTLGFTHEEAVEAIVPGTVFSSCVNAGIEEDPNFGDNIHRVDRSKYDRSFWYRTEFSIPSDFYKEHIWLNFNGVNRKAEIYLNGQPLGTLDGFMERGQYDITHKLNPSGKNILAVLVHIPATPLANQGSPTYLSSGGWDWMPYVPGLNSGITDKVWLSNTGHTTIIDPWIRSELPTKARAELSVELDVKNNNNASEKITIKGLIKPGNIEFTQEITLNALESRKIKFDKRYFPQLIINSPLLWWPAGYGEPNLYTCQLDISDSSG
ncbi:MAG: beta galactosidase jelly roll domain-containing protein, partial [Bacteroidaceae bacterium]|nr:beta galactosidase jelly roll domain-containing protein [Bacteroidaceae bacterium]